MQAITNFLKGVFNFFVGDWIILGGVVTTLLVATLVVKLTASNSATWVGGVIFVAGVALTLFVTLRRETHPK